GEIGLSAIATRPGAYAGAMTSFLRAYTTKNMLRRPGSLRSTDSLAAQLYFMGGYASYFLMNRPLVVQAILRGYEHVVRLGDRPESASWYAFASVAAVIAGRVDLSRRLLTSARETADALGDPGAQSHAAGLAGLTLDMGGAPIEDARVLQK